MKGHFEFSPGRLGRDSSAIVIDATDSGNSGYLRAAELARYLRTTEVVMVVSREIGELDRDSIAAPPRNLRLVHIPQGLGRGAAFRAGFGSTRAESVAMLSLDGYVTPEEIRAVLYEFESQAVDCIIGNRWLSPQTSASTLRRALSQTFSLFARSLFGLSIGDIQAPLKVFRRRVLATVFERLRLADSGFDAELIHCLEKAGATIVERPFSWQALDRGLPYTRASLRAVGSLLAIRLLNSRIGALPFISQIGRRSIIPAKERYSIMLFSWRDPRNPLAGGAEEYLQRQAEYWISAGHEVTWFAQRFRGASHEASIDGMRVVRYGAFPWCFPLAGLWYIVRSRRQFDFIIDCMNGIPFFTPLFSTKPKVCLVHHLHYHHFREELPAVLSGIATWVELKLTPRIYRNTKFITVSNSTKLELEQVGISRFPIEVIHNGVSESYHPGPKFDEPTILYLGRLKRHKRVDKLIYAFRSILASVPEARLIVAGDGDQRPILEKLTRDLGLPRVSFVGRVTDAAKRRLMSGAWVFGMPSSVEGWGIVVIEANACGTPAVAYDVQGLRECIVSGETGRVVADDSTFAEALTEILVDESERQRLSKNALEWSYKFSWRDSARIMLEQLRLSQPWRAVFEPSEPGQWQLRMSAPAGASKDRSLAGVP